MSFSILTVGDGDLSCSLALKRAYGDQVRLVPSTLLCEEELRATYRETASANIEELGADSIKYNVDATQLHRQTFLPVTGDQDPERFDAILFHHPHLGIYFENEEEHAQQHISLISHYLDSARHLLKAGGHMHLCLCGNQAHEWRLQDACNRLGMCITDSFPVSRPMFACLQAYEPSAGWKAPRRFRSGKLGSKHWLCNFGYRHQLTFPQQGNDGRYMNASVSMHYFVQPIDIEGDDIIHVDETNAYSSYLICRICGRKFAREDALKTHLEIPARPPNDAQGSPDNKSIPDPMKNVEACGAVMKSRQEKIMQSESREVVEQKALPDNATSGMSQRQFTVLGEHSGKRLRWFLHQVVQLGSKRHCEKIIQNGLITVQGQLVTDSSRILTHNDLIILGDEEMSDIYPKSSHDLQPIATWPSNRFVVWKPVGMRTAGGFDPTSLESLFSVEMETPYVPVTKLDRGCSGLVLLEKVSDTSTAQVDVALGFTILVHGHVPSVWRKGISLDLPVHALRRWKKVGMPQKEPQDSSALCNANLVLLEQTKTLVNGQTLPALSTLQLTTSSKISGLASVICYSLRKDYDFPVVGDRFASEEYMALPRSMRQRIKQRLCMGCTEITCLREPQCHAQRPLFYQWSAQHWQDHLTSQAPS